MDRLYTKDLFDFKGKKKTITLEEIREHFQLVSHKETCEFIQQCMQHDLISQRGSDKTFEVPKLPTKYNILKEEKCNPYIEEIQYKLHPSISKEYLREHVETYVHYRNDILSISDYLCNPKEIALSINERSLSIFHNEKRLVELKNSNILNIMGLCLKQFNVYQTPEPFFYYQKIGQPVKRILIIENKDTWYTMKFLIHEGKHILGEAFDVLIYGEGRKIESSLECLATIDCEHLMIEQPELYYFGDIDADGIDILSKVMNKYSAFHIKPFLHGYQFLLTHMEEMHSKETDEKCHIKEEDIDRIFSDLTSKEIDKIKEIVQNHCILPQEILNNERLRNYGG